jgi:hypothetical protein
LEWKIGSMVHWLLFLFSLNVLDILFTNVSREANPLALYSWEKIGVLPSAFVKVGLVLFFGVLCVVTSRVASPVEWNFAGRILRLVLIGLVVFYVFVVSWNMILWIL